VLRRGQRGVMAVNVQLATDGAGEHFVHKDSLAQKGRSGNSSPH
jgi:hypothetical protein